MTTYPVGRDLARRYGGRTTLSAPLLREGVAIGAILIRRSEVRPFTDKQIALLQTFADQAVIAIENVRLFTELGGRNRALTEALEQQSATSGILRVISQSPTDVQPVFDTIVRSAVRLCDGLFSGLFKYDGELIHQVAQHNFTAEALEAVHRVYPARPTRALMTGRAILERAVVHIPDVEVDPEYQGLELTRAIGLRSGLWVPMLRDGLPIGVIAVARAKPGPFSNDHITLLKTFADQAVIAIENVRLFNELEARNRDLTDPVGLGFVASLARPGGNLTGLSNLSPELGQKRLEQLREIVPRLTRVAVLGDPSSPSHAPQWRETESAAQPLEGSQGWRGSAGAWQR